MATAVDRVSDLVADITSAFELFTGYTVIDSSELIDDYVIDPEALLLEVPVNLPGPRLVAVLHEAHERLGRPAATRLLAEMLGCAIHLGVA